MKPIKLIIVFYVVEPLYMQILIITFDWEESDDTVSVVSLNGKKLFVWRSLLIVGSEKTVQ